MGSERLPGKVLKKLAGIPSLVHIFRILSKSELTTNFAVVTTTLSEDNTIEELCQSHGVDCYRGSVHDVLDRFRIAAEAEKPDNIIRVTGDDPLMDPGVIDKVISEHLKGSYDYTSNIIERTYPRGMDTEVIRYDTLKSAWQTTADKDDREHVTLFIRRNPELYKMCNVSCDGTSMSHVRLCLDTEEDLKFVSEVYERIYNGDIIRLEQIFKLLDNVPELLKLNEFVSQKTVKGKIF